MKRVLTLLLIMVMAGVALAEYVAQDPTRYIPNARVLGLGKAYIGLSDDAGAMYSNPAGMAGVEGWQLSSMSGKFLDEYTYLSASGLYATDYGVIGFGFAGTSIGGAYATTIEAASDPDDPIYVVDSSQPVMGNYNNAIVISYANELKKMGYLRLDKLPFADKISIGASVKLFKAALYGDSIVGGDASGYELDLGLTAKPQKWLKLGATATNVLPGAMGGKLVYASGHTEYYPVVFLLGTSVNLLGKEESLYRIGDHQLKLLADYEMHPTMKSYPGLMHLGAEWKPIEYIGIRAGIDQDSAGDGNGELVTVSDIAYGVGLYYGGFRFDYAYHTFAGAPNIDNSFFSLSYAFQPPKIEIPKEAFKLYSPKDKLITFAAQVPVSGEVVDYRVKSLRANGVPVKLNLKGMFATTYDLYIGKNAISLESYADKTFIFGKRPRILRLITFPDVPIGYWVDQPTSLLAMAGVITGYPDGTFKPEGNITRAEMCSLIIKSMIGVPSGDARAAFKDVSAKHWAAPYIAEAAKKGIVLGYPGNVFKPNGKITRAEGLLMIARFAGIAEEVYLNQFPDIRVNHWAAQRISGAYNAGILEYLKGRGFEPNKQLTRAETVEMLQRTKVVQDLLKRDLLNWDSY
ncbi:MAG: S-layer homology domain-containing protein [Candidatus Margulisbacteria bacterium]|nr:S-layer homology domain-containing protein [Candidatus Margulisiibacteriota bacterium]